MPDMLDALLSDSSVLAMAEKMRSVMAAQREIGRSLEKTWASTDKDIPSNDEVSQALQAVLGPGLQAVEAA